MEPALKVVVVIEHEKVRTQKEKANDSRPIRLFNLRCPSACIHGGFAGSKTNAGWKHAHILMTIYTPFQRMDLMLCTLALTHEL